MEKAEKCEFSEFLKTAMILEVEKEMHAVRVSY